MSNIRNKQKFTHLTHSHKHRYMQQTTLKTSRSNYETCLLMEIVLWNKVVHIVEKGETAAYWNTSACSRWLDKEEQIGLSSMISL